jgi:hypothetical protein
MTQSLKATNCEKQLSNICLPYKSCVNLNDNGKSKATYHIVIDFPEVFDAVEIFEKGALQQVESV